MLADRSHRLPRRLFRVVPWASIVFIAAVSFSARSAAAHPADMYYQTHAVTLAPEGVEVVWTVAPGTLLAYTVWQNADDDGDGEVSPAEALAWVDEYGDAYALVVDDQPLDIQVTGVEWPANLVDFEVGVERIVIHLGAPWPGGSTALRRLTLLNGFEEAISTNWFALEAQGDITFTTPQQQNGVLALTFALPGMEDALAPGINEEMRTFWDSGTPAFGASNTPGKSPQVGNTTSEARARLTRLISEERLSISFILTALVIALGLGAIHALTPGHGKALVGAYLVGSKGTMRHAVALGGIVTLTHTGSVMAFGVVALLASRYIMPTDLFPVLEVLSGALIVSLGAFLLYRRWRGWRAVRMMRQRVQQQLRQQQQIREQAAALVNSSRTGAAPAGVSVPMAAAGRSGASATIQIHQAISVNVYNDILPDMSGVNWRALVALGVSGGLVPCPDAIAILLVAVAINRVVLGLSLIVTFSLGLSIVLTAIGIAMVRSQRLLERFNAFERAVPFLPVLSALTVAVLGLALTVSAVRRSGWFDVPGSSAAEVPGEGRESTLAVETFKIDTAEFVYLGVDLDNSYQLVRAELDGRSAVTLTAEPLGVWDYSLGPDGQRIMYASPRLEGGSDLWLIDLDNTNRQQVVACPESTCTRPVWSPDGARVVYERMELPSATAPNGSTSLWWVDIESGETAAVFQDSQLPGFTPSWSPDGQWLTFSTQGAGSIQLYHLGDSTRQSITSQTGNPVTWKPDGKSLLVTDVWSAHGQIFTHVFRYDVDTDALTDLTGPGVLGDTWTGWSPDGQWIAVVRRDFGGDTPAMGDQVWIMRPDGSDARALTDVPDVIHGAPVWSPDSRYLIFERFPLAGSEAPAGIFVLDTVTQELRQVAEKGNWPTWLPG